jgi:hypothetical protein
MGRTNSTYRNHLDRFIDQFKPFRKGLREKNKEYLDSLWEKAHRHASAGAFMNATNPGLPAMISIMLGMQKEIQENQREIERLKQEIEE